MCTLSITSVTPLYAQGALSQIVVTGTATDCDVVNVTIRCKTLAKLSPVKVDVTKAAFTATFQAAELKSAGCVCGGNTTVDVSCANGACKAPQWSGTLACCPDLAVSVQPTGECTADGHRLVSLSAQNLGPAPTTGTWNFGDPPPNNTAAVNLPLGPSQTTLRPYPPGTYTATLSRPGCPDHAVQFTVTPCCTTLVISATVGQCGEGGQRSVVLTAQNTGSVGVTAHWDAGGSPFTLAPGATHTEQFAYSPGAYTATIQVPGCPDQSVDFVVESCCPQVTVSVTMDKLCNDGKRQATLHASNPGPAVVTGHWKYGDGTPDGPTFTLAAGATDLSTHDYPPGPYTATLAIDGCPPQTVVFTVPPCCPDITVSVQVLDCTADGVRQVKLLASSAGPAAATVHWEFDDNSPPGIPFSIVPNTSNFEQHFFASGTHTATLKVKGCPDVPVTFQVPPCCPVVTISVRLGECNAGVRSVTLNASSTGPNTVNAFWVFGDGSQNGAAFPLGPGSSGAEQHNYAPGQYTATLIIGGCPAQSISITVAACPECPPGLPPGCTDLSGCVPVNIDGCLNLPGCVGGCLNGCLKGCVGLGCSCTVLCFLWVVLLAGYLLGIALGALANVVALVITTVVLVLVAVLYIRLCGICALVRCTRWALIVVLLAVLLFLLLGIPMAGLGPAAVVAIGIVIAAYLVHRRFCKGSWWW